MTSKRSGVPSKTVAALAATVPRKAKQGEERLGPTPEQRTKGSFRRESAQTTHGQVSAVAYRREPFFETLARGKSGIDKDGLYALRFYRDRYEATAASLTKCALDIQGRGGGSPQRLPPILDADRLVRQLEAAMGAVADTVRAVALEDKSFSEVAIARFGSRTQTWIEQEKERGRTKKGAKMVFVEKIVPKSGRHREIIRDEFALGLRRLVDAVRPHISTGRPERAA